MDEFYISILFDEELDIVVALILYETGVRKLGTEIS